VLRIAAEPRLLLRLIVTSFVIQCLTLAVPVMTGAMVDRIAVGSDHRLLAVLSVAALVMASLLAAASWLRARLLLVLKARLDVGLSLGLVTHLLALPYAFFLRRATGDLVTRVNSGAAMREILASSTLATLIDGPMAAVHLALIVPLAGGLTFLVLGLAAVELIVLLVSQGRNIRLLTENLEAQAHEQSHLVQLVHGIETVKAAGAEAQVLERWENLFVRELNLGVERGCLAARWDAVIDAIRVAAPLVVLSGGAYRVASGRMTVGTAVAVAALASGFLNPVGSLVVTVLRLQWLSGYLHRINDVLDTPAEASGPAPAPDTAMARRGAVTVEEVSFRYAPAGDDVLHDVTIRITAGETVAIVGRSGSGKSTLAGLIATLLRPTSGSVSVDGRDVADLDVRAVRRRLGIVCQTPYLFGTTIRDNITLADPSVPMEDVVRAAEIACIHEDIVSLPMGYETVLADGGASISGGQRQRLALARALVHEPAVLVLDEATSALDAVTERRVHQHLARLGCTTVIVAHRLSTIRHADRILVLEDGRIVEEGPHDTLLDLRGAYHRLVAATTGPAGASELRTTDPKGASMDHASDDLPLETLSDEELAEVTGGRGASDIVILSAESGVARD
jgi:ATP-binding cassette subfamily B protein